MIPKEQAEKYREQALTYFEKAHIVLTTQEKKSIELADMGLNDYEKVGLALIVYLNTKRCCAKEMVLLPYQICPDHFHPSLNGVLGKEETFRCRWGTVHVYVEGEPNCEPDLNGWEKYSPYLLCRHEVVLHPGEQYTLKPDSWHWFGSGAEGAVISEFSTSSHDETDLFRDPHIQRITVVDK